MDGASFLNKFRERLQQKRAARQEMQGMQNDQSMGRIDSMLNPMSNGTGSARPNFGQFAQKAIGSVMGGNKMGDALGFRQGVNEKLDKIQEAVGSDQGDPNANAAGMPPVDPMTGGGVMNSQQSKTYVDPSSQPEMAQGPSASAKKIAKKQAKQYAAEKGLSDKEAKSLKKEAKKSQSFDKDKNEHADNLAGGANNKTVNFGGSMKDIDPPKGNTMKSDNTSYMNNRKDINQMKGDYSGLERRESSDPSVNFSRMMNKDLAKTMFEDKGFYSAKERKRQASVLGYDEVSRSGPLNKTGQTIAKGPKKPKAKPQSEMKMLRSVKGLEPKKKLMATKTVAKFKKKPLQKVTPRPAKKL
jgi:hypothetical protein